MKLLQGTASGSTLNPRLGKRVMEGLETDVGAFALEMDHAEVVAPAEHVEHVAPVEQAPRRNLPRERERKHAIAIEAARRALLAELVELDFGFNALMGLSDRLATGELRLRAVVDVGGDLGPRDDEDDDGPSEPVRRTLAAFKRVGRLRAEWLRRGKTERRRETLVTALRALAIHPAQLRTVDDRIGELLDRVESSGRRGRARLERETLEPLAAFRRHARAARAAHARLEHAKEDMFQANIALVHGEVAKFTNRGIDAGDLEQEASIGLMRAVDKFDHERGFRFSTYAHWWVRQAITRSLSDHSRMVRLPVNMNEQLTRLRRASAELTQKLARQPTFAELGDAAGMTAEKAEANLALLRTTVSLDEPVDADGETTRMELVADDSAVDPTIPATESELRAGIEHAIGQLKPNEQRVIRRRFGIGGSDGETLEEIGQSLGVSRERIRQIERKALMQLKRSGRAMNLDVFLH